MAGYVPAALRVMNRWVAKCYPPSKNERGAHMHGVEIFTKDKADNVQTIINIGGVDCYEKDGIAYLKLENVARGLGFTTVAASGNEVVRWNTVYVYLTDLKVVAGSCNGNYQSNCPEFIPENIFYRLAMKAKNETAEKFQAKVADEIIPSIRRTGSYSSKNSNIEQGIAVVKFIADDLKVSTASRLFMYENYCKDVGIPTGFLPKYEDNGSREQCSATTLLERNGCGIKTAKFNQLLIASGYMELKERTTSKGETKEYKALTDKGIKYGVNLISNKNQKEVQPYYYADTFMELYNMVTE